MGRIPCQNERRVVGPAEQVFWTGDDRLCECRHGAAIAAMTRRGPEGNGRRWSHTCLGESLLVLCGENNVLVGGGSSGSRARASSEGRKAGLEQQRKMHGLVANPTHTRQGPQASRDKKAAFAPNGLVVSVANCHGPYRHLVRDKKKPRPMEKPGRPSWKSAEFFRNGSPRMIGTKELKKLGNLWDDGYAIWLFDHSP